MPGGARLFEHLGLPHLLSCRGAGLSGLARSPVIVRGRFGDGGLCPFRGAALFTLLYRLSIAGRWDFAQLVEPNPFAAIYDLFWPLFIGRGRLLSRFIAPGNLALAGEFTVVLAFKSARSPDFIRFVAPGLSSLVFRPGLSDRHSK